MNLSRFLKMVKRDIILSEKKEKKRNREWSHEAAPPTSLISAQDKKFDADKDQLG